MSNHSIAQSLIEERKEAFDSILKEAVSKPKVLGNSTENNDLTVNSDNSDVSNKTFLLNRFLEHSKTFDSNNELILKVPKPVPKPRKSKSNLPQKIIKSSDNNNSDCSQKTYNVEDNNGKRKQVESVEVVVHNRPTSSAKSISSKKSSSNAAKTYVKSTSKFSNSSQETINILTDSGEGSHDHISITESNVSSEKSSKTKTDKDVKDNRKYSYEKIVEIIIHKTDALQLDSYVIHPTVKVHIIDIDTGKYYPKSNKSRSVVFYYENEEQEYILPVMTGSYNLQEKRTFSPEWEESILLNEDFSYLANENVIMFFEVLDYVPFISKKSNTLQKYPSKGWHRITFAFLKLTGGDQSLNVNKKIKLQLYYPKNTKKCDPCKCDLWDIWKASKLKKYPSALYVTIKEVISPKNVIETFRSKTPLQKENINVRSYKRNSGITNEKDITARIDSRCSKKSFELPNKPIAELDSYDNGCFLLKFSNNGSYLACAVQIKEAFTVIVYEVNSLEEVHCVNEHRGLIYSIQWSSDDSQLITASADNTVVIWSFTTNSFQQILPHPIYVYASHMNDDNTIIATGGYDCTIRIWLFGKQENKYQLHQEMEEHEGFVTSICFNKKSTNLYSSDSIGHILEWKQLDNFDWQFVRDISTADLKNTVINEILLFPKEKKMLVHARDSKLRIISIKRGCVLHWLQGALNSRIQTYCSITSCGRYVTSGSENGLVVVWDAKTGKDITTYEPFSNHLYLETVHCVQFHPKDSLITFSHFGSVCPILLYHYNDSNVEMKQKNTSQDVSQRNDKSNVSKEKSESKENISFHDVLEKMDKLLN